MCYFFFFKSYISLLVSAVTQFYVIIVKNLLKIKFFKSHCKILLKQQKLQLHACILMMNFILDVGIYENMYN